MAEDTLIDSKFIGTSEADSPTNCDALYFEVCGDAACTLQVATSITASKPTIELTDIVPNV